MTSAQAVDSAGFIDDEPDFDVSKYPEFEYSMKAVREAGKIISRQHPDLDKALWAFKVAHNWRDAHAFPLKSVRHQVAVYARVIGIEGITAGRLKRMQAIRKKIGRVGLGLNQIQDLAGCRAIVNTTDDVKALCDTLIDRSRHELWRKNDYIDNPKEKDGYRSCHLIFQYKGEGDASVFDGRRIEIQIRTRLQHSWATAVEAVGLFRGEDLKGNKGDDRWLRLFKLMSAEFAELEGCNPVPSVQAGGERVKEIIALENELAAVETLENLSNAVTWAEDAVTTTDMPIYYLITYYNDSNTVDVAPYFHPMRAMHDYNEAEEARSRNNTTVVLVEAGKVKQLREAYPNYFGDVQHFKQNLKRITKGKSAKQYVVTPQERVREIRAQVGDLRWIRHRGRWR